ncbi:NUDIX domain-containing protein [Candidatus Microgenomates bacterium]|nr:NUDIX domain-containing protein [Candidatus Microgenomates bacterium]
MDKNNRQIIFEFDDTDGNYQGYFVRKAARGILLKDGLLGIIYMANIDCHKFPGGGMQPNETPEETFKREVKEETGCNCELLLDNGDITLEFRSEHKLAQISYIFIAKAVGEASLPSPEKDEREEGLTLKWVTPLNAEGLISNSNPTNYDGLVMKARDQKIFEFYKDKLLDFSR